MRPNNMWTSPGRPFLAYVVDGRNDIRMSPGCASEFVVDVVMGTGRATSEFVVNKALGGAVVMVSLSCKRARDLCFRLRHFMSCEEDNIQILRPMRI
jgi:hypothetical protein